MILLLREELPRLGRVPADRALQFASLRRENQTLKRTFAADEREAIVQTLERTSGNVKKSAQILHCPRPTFYRKLKKFGIKVERPKESIVQEMLANAVR